MTRILIKSGWLGSNTRKWYEDSGDLGDHIIGIVTELEARGYLVDFSGEKNKSRKNQYRCEIHIERQLSFENNKKICLYCEPSFVQPQNIIFPEPKYDLIFRMDRNKNLKLNEIYYSYPRNFTNEPLKKWVDRDLLISCISANKNSVLRSKHSLYVKRRNYIFNFTERFGFDFHLYGGGWDLRNHPIGLIGKMLFRVSWLRPLLKRPNPIPSYRGKCDSKGEVMLRSRFSLCIENTQYPGCMTEKMIDCFRFGTVPLYLGPRDISDMIDPSLYIDLRRFGTDTELFEFIEAFNEADYEKWLQNLQHHRVKISENHSVQRFASRIVDAVDEVLREGPA